jgi:protease-4
MIKCGALRNILAAFGAVFLGVFALAVLIGIFAGEGVTGDKVAVVDIQGVITDSYEVNQTLRDLGEREDVRAVVLRIESPGGAVGPSQEIHSEVLRLREKKPVVASMGSIAASGGYYTAVAAEKIMANPGTITGSIGVIVEFINAQELLGKIGLKGYVVKSGKYKDVGSPLREMEKEEKEYLQSLINDVNGQFIEAVASGRGLKAEEVRKLADGRIFTGAQARELKLVDELGGLSDAIELGASLAGLEEEPVVIYPERQKMTFWKTFSGGASIDKLTELFTGLRVMYMIENPAR